MDPQTVEAVLTFLSNPDVQKNILDQGLYVDYKALFRDLVCPGIIRDRAKSTENVQEG